VENSRKKLECYRKQTYLHVNSGNVIKSKGVIGQAPAVHDPRFEISDQYCPKKIGAVPVNA